MKRYATRWAVLAGILLSTVTVLGCTEDRVESESNPNPEGSEVTQLVDEAYERIRSLQKGRTGSDKEKAIVALFESLEGDALHELKRRLDHGSHRNLLHLLYSDIDDSRLRQRALDHFAQQAVGQPRRLKVLSDIDDTLYANWVDARFPKGTTYPGILAFYAELARVGSCDPSAGGCVVFISARPGDRTGITENPTLGTLQERGVVKPVVLAGDVVSLRSHEAMAKRKYENFTKYRGLFPEFDYIFVGDSGQGDAVFGARMRADFPDQVKAVFIHDVVNAEKGQAVRTPEQRAASAAEGVFFVDTYAGAALIAEKQGLLDRAGALRVVEAARADLAALALPEPLAADRTRELEQEATALQ
jgi:hypothetical protein